MDAAEQADIPALETASGSAHLIGADALDNPHSRQVVD
jgi:hypothetical protein